MQNGLKLMYDSLKNETPTLKSPSNEKFYQEKNELIEKELQVLQEKIKKYEENRKLLNEFIEEKGKHLFVF